MNNTIQQFPVVKQCSGLLGVVVSAALAVGTFAILAGLTLTSVDILVW